MATQVKLPELGDGIESGDVLEVFVQVGQVIAEGDDIVEMETDKATVPVPSSVGGKVTKINVAEGDTVPVGGVLLEVEVAASRQEAAQPAPPVPASRQEAAQPKPPVPASRQEAAQSEPDTRQVSATRATDTRQESATKSAAEAAPATPTKGATAAVSSAGTVIPAGPAIRRFAREVGVDLAAVSGTGDGGRITRTDVLSVVRAASQAATKTAPTRDADEAPAAKSPGKKSEGLPGTADADDFGPIRVERIDRMRKTIAAQMNLSWSTVPRVTNFDDADITDLERLRQSSKDDYAAQGLKLTTMPFLIKAVATALRRHPSLNAVFDTENNQIIYRDYVNIGIAVDTDRGLVVPVMPGVDRQGIPDVTRALAAMAGKVRDNQFSGSDLKGGTFTISNLGAIGGQYSTPIVNVPEVAILLVGRSRKLPVVMPDDSIQPRLMMPLSLSYDHRLVDGGAAARFLNDVISLLQAPSRLLLAL